MDEKTMIELLATVQEQSSLTPHTIPVSSLLQDNFIRLNQHYFIHDISKLNEILTPGEDIYILSHIVTEDFPRHNHDYFELTYVIKGSVVNVVDGNELYMNAGDLSLVNPQAIHELRCINPDTTLVNICIKPSLLEGTLKKFSQSKSPVAVFLSGQAKKCPPTGIRTAMLPLDICFSPQVIRKRFLFISTV